MREAPTHERKRRVEPERAWRARVDRDKSRARCGRPGPEEERPALIEPDLEHVPWSFGADQLVQPPDFGVLLRDSELPCKSEGFLEVGAGWELAYTPDLGKRIEVAGGV